MKAIENNQFEGWVEKGVYLNGGNDCVSYRTPGGKVYVAKAGESEDFPGELVNIVTNSTVYTVEDMKKLRAYIKQNGKRVDE